MTCEERPAPHSCRCCRTPSHLPICPTDQQVPVLQPRCAVSRQRLEDRRVSARALSRRVLGPAATM
eukprot:scaffold26005_cov105-Isochrysis_galbana.AAC.5